MFKIDRAFDAMLELHNTILQSRLAIKDNYNPVSFAREFQTVKLDIGRQVGKTWYIARTATDNDIIISVNALNSRYMKEVKSNFDIKNTIIVCDKSSLVESESINTVWIDDASLFNKEDLDLIYSSYAGKAKKFILIG